MTELDQRCACTSDDGGFGRQCDYCSTEWLTATCPHDAAQPPCPECDVAPVVQLV